MNEKQAQLEWESRMGRFAAGAAFLSALCVIGAFIARISIGKGSTKKAESLRIAHNHVPSLIGYSVATALSFLVLTAALLYLYKATKFRRPEMPSVAAVMSVLGPILLTIGGVVGIILLLHAASDFVTSGPQTELRAKHLSESSSISTLAGIGLAGSLSTGLGLGMVSLHAMRAGLLSRFMGVLGMIFGALQVLPILPAPVIQLFWTVALGLLFLDSWPGATGRGPAWEEGEAVEWPSAQSRMVAQRAAAEETADEEPEVTEPQAQRNPNARSRKRKKKTRR